MKVAKDISSSVSIEAEGDTHTEIWEQLARMQEVFGQEACEKCHGDKLLFVVREVVDGKKVYKYYELHCQNQTCRARLSFGQHNEGGTLFPKRKDDAKGSITGKPDSFLPSNGWLRWDKERSIHF